MIYDILNNLNIKYEEVSHKPVYTSKEAEFIKSKISGIGAKNLFLTDKKGHYYLVLMDDTKRADLKALTKITNSSHLTFTSDEELKNILGLKRGSVTPLGIINDTNNLVKLLIDKDLQANYLLMHPLINTKTISITYDDLIKFLTYYNHEYLLINI